MFCFLNRFRRQLALSNNKDKGLLPLIFLLSVAAFNTTAESDTTSQLAFNEIVVDGKSYFDLKKATAAIGDFSQVYLGPGEYAGLLIAKNYVRVEGSKGTVFNKPISGKAAIVVRGDGIEISQLECRDISVSAGNGACIRQELGELVVRNVYFHSSEQGILSNKETKYLEVRHSHFENLGKAGLAHAIYAQGQKLKVVSSKIINSKDQGHEIKSRARTTEIINSIVGSHLSNDSRAVDIAQGGELTIKNSILLKGLGSVSAQLIGFGLERPRHQLNHNISITGSLISVNRSRGNRLILTPEEARANIAVDLSNNLIVGKNVADLTSYKANNQYYEDLLDIGVVEAHKLDMDQLNALKTLWM